MGVTLRKRPIGKGRESLYLDIYHSKGNRKTVPLEIYLEPNSAEENRRKMKLAKSVLRQAQEDFENNLHGFISPQKRKEDFIAFFDSLIATKKGTTAVGYRSAREQVVRYIGSTSFPFTALTIEWVKGFRQYLMNDAGLHQNTARAYFERVRAIVKAAVEADILRKSPFKRGDAIPELEAETEFATVEELMALDRTPCLDPEVKRAYFFAVATGLRKVDIRQLDRSQIRDNKIIKRIQKTDNYTYKAISESARAILGTLPEEGLLFNLPNDGRIDWVMRKWVADAKIQKKLTFHSSRHTFATMLLKAGVDLVIVARLLDHTNTQHTMRYLHIVDKQKEDALNALPSFFTRPSPDGSAIA